MELEYDVASMQHEYLEMLLSCGGKYTVAEALQLVYSLCRGEARRRLANSR